ncbi:hypothetical protein [Lentzea albida]|uniref:Uncharacterized protein n=1 Tax=Lentzea albida TaxID=65499 RepID=A0A1H9VHS3_9PSEU|nr:hypothetical protein [Lentzea albida]SES21129.1 hypothetical protein SAMN04488000_118128 [Lentzea albida]
MPDRYVARDSAELVGVRVTATTVAGTAVNPTGYTVTVAVVPESTVTPTSGDYKVATWQTGARGTFAVLLVGPGSSVGTLAPGNYKLWAKVSASPETPVVKSPDRLVIY